MDICEAASDSAIRTILRSLPRGLSETYARMVRKAEKSPNANYVERAFRWISFARRPLRVEELQEATAFNMSDKSWDREKIPDANRLLQACHGLVVRDSDRTFRFAHHTIKQFLLVPKEERLGYLWWRGGQKEQMPFAFTECVAQVTIAETCAAYLCFSDFEAALTTIDQERGMTMDRIFNGGGPVAIPASLGIKRSIYDIPYRFFGGDYNIKVPEIDFERNARKIVRATETFSTFVEKYGEQ